MNILPVDFPTFSLVNYRNLNCFIFLTWLLQRKFNNAKNYDNVVIEMFVTIYLIRILKLNVR